MAYRKENRTIHQNMPSVKERMCTVILSSNSVFLKEVLNFVNVTENMYFEFKKTAEFIKI